MIIKNNNDYKNNKEYLVYGFYSVYGNKIFITYEDENSPLNFIAESECQILDSTLSKHWIKHDKDKYLPDGWNDTNFLYELVDDLEPLKIEKFKIIKDKIDEEFAYYFLDNSKELQDQNIVKIAEAIGDKWVLCPECNEAFEVDENKGVIVCPNVACKIQMNNPYAKKFPSIKNKEVSCPRVPKHNPIKK